jgi:hypothetical protein
MTDTELLRSIQSQIQAHFARVRVIDVGARDDLQAAIDAAEPGSTLLLTPGARYNAVVMPAKPLTLQTAGPLAAGRLQTNAGALPVIRSEGTAVSFAPGASDVVFRGIEIVTERPKATAFSIGRGDETSVDGLPRTIVFDRVWVHADPLLGAKRGIACNGGGFILRDSVVEEFWEEYGEAQAVCGWNGPGPFTIINNYLSGSGENVMFGGADCKIPGVAPSGLTLIGNYLHKPDSWRAKRGAVKNIFELKNMRNAVITENVFSGSWTSAQAGHGILFTPRNQNGTRPDSTVTDVQFWRNLVERVDGFGISMQGWDNEKPIDAQARGMRIDSNVIHAPSGIAISRGWNGLAIENNTFAGVTRSWISFSAKVTDGAIPVEHQTKTLSIRGNLAQSGAYGIVGDDMSPGTPTLDVFAPGYIVERNAIEQSVARRIPYPTANLIVAAGKMPLDANGRPVMMGYGCEDFSDAWEKARSGRP